MTYVNSYEIGSSIINSFLSQLEYAFRADEIRFEMKDLGTAKKILEMEIHRNRGANKLSLSLKNYVEGVLSRFDMSKEKYVSTPLANHFKLSLEQCPKTDSDIEGISKTPYSSAVSCLMHVMVCTRLDLAQAVSQVFKFMFNQRSNIGK